MWVFISDFTPSLLSNIFWKYLKRKYGGEPVNQLYRMYNSKSDTRLNINSRVGKDSKLYQWFIYYFSGCFLRVLEDRNTVCIFCHPAAADLDNITICTYSKAAKCLQLQTCHVKLILMLKWFFLFIASDFLCAL